MVAKSKKFIIILLVVVNTVSHAGIAQSVEHFTRNEGVVGSSPISSFVRKTVILITRVTVLLFHNRFR